jgi:cytochrome b6-f complex iron-sulfur subunit
MESQPIPSRRTVLHGAGILAGGLAGSSLLAACGGSDSSSATTPPPASSAPAAGGGQPLAALSAIPDGSTISVKDPSGGTVLLTRAGDSVTGLSAKCTHMGCTVAPAGSELHCPCHGSKFAAGTGAVLNGPAKAPLSPVSVTVTNGQVVKA